MKSLIRIFSILTPKQQRHCVLLVIMMLIGAVIEAIGIGALYPLIAIISNPHFLEKHLGFAKLMETLGVKTHSALIIFSSVCLILFYLFKNIFVIVRTHIEVRFTTNLQLKYITQMFSLYLYKPYLYRVNINSSILGRNISISGNVFQNILIPTLDLIAEAITFVVIWTALFIMDWRLTIVIIAIAGPLTYFVMCSFRKKLIDFGTRQKKLMAEQSKWAAQGFGSLKETKVMQTESFFVSKFNDVYAKMVDISRRYAVVQRFPRSFVEMLGMGGILILVITQIAIGADPALLVPSLGVFALAATRLMPSINRIIGYYNMIKFNIPNLNEVYDDMMLIRHGEDEAERGIAKQKPVKMSFENEIAISDLTFRYPNTKEDVLHDVSFTIPKSSFVGIVGPSGAGKTTFVDILLGLLPPTKGEIMIDGVNVQTNTSGWLMNIAYVPQKIFLIDASVRENIALGIDSKDIDEDKLYRAMKSSEIYDMVQLMPQGDKTKVGEDGCRLSGGQRQRIGIARALYRDPDVLVLDEATSALDTETEKSITATILKLKSSITIISIAHRLTTLADCDFKIRFDKGHATKEA